MEATGVEARPCAGAEDEERSLAIYNAVWPLDSVSMTEVESFKSAMLEYRDHLAFLAGDPVGSATIAISPSRPEQGFLLLTVLPHSRRRGVGTVLYRLVSRWLAERGLGVIGAPVREDDGDSLAYALRRGFVEVERNSYLVLELGGYEPPPVNAPRGIEIVTWAERPELARRIYEIACEAYPDVPGERDTHMEPFEDWLAHDMRGSGDLPEATFLALAGDDVVGYAKFSFTKARPKDAGHDMTAVRRAWRGRGIAGALKRAQIAWAKEAGFERLRTQNEVRNEPIRRLNERLGYRSSPGRIVVRGPLASE